MLPASPSPPLIISSPMRPNPRPFIPQLVSVRHWGVSLDAFFGIGDHCTATEETLQAEKDGLEHRLENKRKTIGLMEAELNNLRHSVKLYRWIMLGLSLLIVGLFVWCVWVDIHCANYGFWRG